LQLLTILKVVFPLLVFASMGRMSSVYAISFNLIIFDIPITVAAITYTTTRQQKAKRMSLNQSFNRNK
jgi:hypothetical protein